MKITRTTIKSFIKKNQLDLFIKVLSEFNGMTDGVEAVGGSFSKVEGIDFENSYSFGICGLWLVGQSRDGFEAFENEKFIGYKIYNCCGSSIIATRKVEKQKCQCVYGQVCLNDAVKTIANDGLLWNVCEYHFKQISRQKKSENNNR